ncbi:MAG: glycosyltransferase [Eubacteriales bacterium]|nr:glycosyltransferase [Eubacteriales bacterium]
MEKRTVCLFNDSFPPVIDGVANAVINYAENIEKKYGHAIVATPDVPGADDSGFAFPVLRYPSIDTRRLVGYMAGYPFSPEIAGRLSAERVELLHTHCPVSSCFLARSLRDVVDAPLVLTYHTKYDIDIAKAIRGKALQAGAIRALVQNVSACDEVWVVSRGAGENLRSLGYEGDYIVMENGVDLPRGSAESNAVLAATKDYDLPRGVPMFLFVGRLMWYKGIRIILDALRKLQEAGTDFRMVFIGDGADGAEVRQYADELGLRGRCFFTGSITEREKLRAWYTRADLFLFPSTFDTNGLVVREAAACGTATVMIRNSCASEGVTDGENGFLIEENAACLAAALQRQCAVPETIKQVGSNAQQQLYISWETAVSRACERYEIVIDNYRSGRYKKHNKPFDGFLKSQGELMEVLAGVDRIHDEAIAEIRREHLRQVGDLEERNAEMRRHIRKLEGDMHQVREEFKKTCEAFWQNTDRYL